MEDILVVIIVSLVIGLVAAGITCFVVYKKYKTKLKSPIYPIDDYTTLDLTDHSDSFIGRTVTRVRVSSSNKKN